MTASVNGALPLPEDGSKERQGEESGGARGAGVNSARMITARKRKRDEDKNPGLTRRAWGSGKTMAAGNDNVQNEPGGTGGERSRARSRGKILEQSRIAAKTFPRAVRRKSA